VSCDKATADTDANNKRSAPRNVLSFMGGPAVYDSQTSVPGGLPAETLPGVLGRLKSLRLIGD
jgi:hypothetical protein